MITSNSASSSQLTRTNVPTRCTVNEAHLSTFDIFYQRVLTFKSFWPVVESHFVSAVADRYALSAKLGGGHVHVSV